MLKNTSNERKIIEVADPKEGRDIPRYDAWTVARVVGWARVPRKESLPNFPFNDWFQP